MSNDANIGKTSNLSKREQEVLRHLVQLKSNKEIALALNICEKTVEKHLTNIYNKIGVLYQEQRLFCIELHKVGISLLDIRSKTAYSEFRCSSLIKS